MSEWVWVFLGYAVAYGALGGYLTVLLRRRARVRHRVSRPR